MDVPAQQADLFGTKASPAPEPPSPEIVALVHARLHAVMNQGKKLDLAD